jgi:hypothetical protein
MFDQVVSPGLPADPSSALDRFALRTLKVERPLAWMPHGWRGMDHPVALVAKLPNVPRTPRLSARSRTGRAGTKAQTSASDACQ